MSTTLAVTCATQPQYVAVAEADGDVAGADLFFETYGIIQMHLDGPRTAYMRPSPSHLLIRSVVLRDRGRSDPIAHLGGGRGGAVDDSLFASRQGPHHAGMRTARCRSSMTETGTTC